MSAASRLVDMARSKWLLAARSSVSASSQRPAAVRIPP